MALAFTNQGASADPDIQSSVDATSYASASWTPPNELVLLAVWAARSGGPDTPTVSGNGITWTQIGTTLAFGSGRGLSVFAANGSGASAGATTIDFGANTQLGCVASFSSVSGADLSGGVAAAIVQSPTSSGTATSGSVTLSAAGHADNRPWAAFGIVANEAQTERTNWTELDDLGGVGPVRHLETQYRGDAFETTASCTWTSNVAWGGVALEIKAAGSGTTYNQSASGTLTTAGAISRVTNKTVAGTLTTAGAIAKAIGKTVAGTLTTAGALAKHTAKSFAGTLTTAGALTTARIYTAVLSGTLTTAGTLSKQTSKSVAGTLTTAGTLVKSTSKGLAGTLSTAGALVKQTAKGVGGTLSMSGAISKLTQKALAGVLSLVGTLTAIIFFDDVIDATVSDAAVYTATLSDAAVTTATLLDAAVTIGTLANVAVYTATHSNSAVYSATISDTARS